MKTLNQLRDEIHMTATKNGLYEGKEEVVEALSGALRKKGAECAFFAQKIALIHSKLSEALEAHRKGVYGSLPNYDAFIGVWEESCKGAEDTIFKRGFEKYVKGGLEDELADAIVHILDLCGEYGVDIERHVELNMRYNTICGCSKNNYGGW